MDAKRVRSIILSFVSLCALVVGTSEGIRKVGETFLLNGVPGNIKEIDEDTAEQVWIHCRDELKESAEGFEDFDLSLPEAATGNYNEKSGIALLKKRITHKAISNLTPQVKQNLLDCLRKKNSPSQYSGKEVGSMTWFIKCRELLLSWSSIPRRYLASKRHKHRVASRVRRRHRHSSHTRHQDRLVNPAPAYAPTAASPAYAPIVTSPVYARTIASPAYAPTTSHQTPYISQSSTFESPIKAPEPSLPPDLNDLPSPSTAIFPPPRSHGVPPGAYDNPPIPFHNNNNNKKYVIAAIAAGVVAAFVIVFFLFCCLRGSKKNISPTVGHRDEKPLLNFCSSDISAGSSQKSVSVENSSSKNFSMIKNSSIVVDIHNSSLGEGQSSEGMIGASENTDVALTLPPGRIAPPLPAPPPPPKPPAPSPPPPPKVARPPPNPPKSGNPLKPSPLGLHHQKVFSLGEGNYQTGESDAPKTKLKPFFWDKVLANPDHSMVWHDIKAGSFQFNEEMIETLFGYSHAEKNRSEHRKDGSSQSAIQYIQIIDSKKSQNLAILLKALNVTVEEVCDALKEGNELPIELIQTLLKMAPTMEEELKLRLYGGNLSQLGPAERFLKIIVDIPFAFKRLESLLFMSSLQEEVSFIKESFSTLEVACNELRNSRLFLKLLEAVLKTGNRMNDGTFRGGAQAFKLDTLLKLSDVKGTDGKTTLLHFVVQEIIRSEGIRAERRARESRSMSSVRTEDLVEDSSPETSEYYRGLGLQVVSGLSNELENVRKAALIDGDVMTTTISKLGHSLVKTRNFLNNEVENLEEDTEFHDTLASFVQHAEADITWLLEEEKRIMALVKNITDYFHGNSGKDEGLRLFVIVRDFLIILDKACKVVRSSSTMPMKNPRKEAITVSPSQDSRQQSLSDVQQKIFPAIRERQMDDSSSDDDSSSP